MCLFKRVEIQASLQVPHVSAQVKGDINTFLFVSTCKRKSTQRKMYRLYKKISKKRNTRTDTNS